MSVREEKKAKTRKQIFQSGMRLFMKQGFDETTVDDIAKAAGISRRTFFRYFPTKEAAFFAEQEERLIRFHQVLQDRQPEESGYELVKRACLMMGRVYMADKELVLTQNRIIYSSKTLKGYDSLLDDQWEQAIFEALLECPDVEESGQKKAGMDKALYARVISGALIGTIRALLREWIASEGTKDLEEMGLKALSLLENGFTSQ